MYEKIVKFCEERKIPIVAFERICGMPNGYILKLERGMKPGIKHVKRASQVMGISIEELTESED